MAYTTSLLNMDLKIVFLTNFKGKNEILLINPNGMEVLRISLRDQEVEELKAQMLDMEVRE